MYLTEDRKKIYMADFNENVLKCNQEFWKLNEELKPILIEINNNPFIQTLYSSKKINIGSSIIEGSYLEICYSKDMELNIINNIIPFFEEKYNIVPLQEEEFNNEIISKFSYSIQPPKDNPNFNGTLSRHNLACLNDNDYWRINFIELHLDSSKAEIHNSFWQDLCEKLKSINTKNNN